MTLVAVDLDRQLKLVRLLANDNLARMHISSNMAVDDTLVQSIYSNYFEMFHFF